MPTPRWTSAYYCEGASPEGMQMIPITQFLRENHYTRDQVIVLLRKRRVLGKMYKNRLYLRWNPDYLRAINLL
jgi:hypothetical protein